MLAPLAPRLSISRLESREVAPQSGGPFSGKTSCFPGKSVRVSGKGVHFWLNSLENLRTNDAPFPETASGATGGATGVQAKAARNQLKMSRGAGGASTCTAKGRTGRKTSYGT